MFHKQNISKYPFWGYSIVLRISYIFLFLEFGDLFSFGLGITWASMMAMPYEMLAASIPQGKTGIYMGIFNMFIVIPMIIQIFSVQYFVYDLLGQNPINIIRLAGVFLIIGGIFSMFVSQPNTIES